MPDPLQSAHRTSKDRPLTGRGRAASKGIGWPAEMGLSASIQPSPWHVSHRICRLRIESAIVVAQYRFGNAYNPKLQARLTEGRDGNNGLLRSGARHRLHGGHTKKFYQF